jgi:hypothetical protein
VHFYQDESDVGQIVPVIVEAMSIGMEAAASDYLLWPIPDGSSVSIGFGPSSYDLAIVQISDITEANAVALSLLGDYVLVDPFVRAPDQTESNSASVSLVSGNYFLAIVLSDNTENNSATCSLTSGNYFLAIVAAPAQSEANAVSIALISGTYA